MPDPAFGCTLVTLASIGRFCGRAQLNWIACLPWQLLRERLGQISRAIGAGTSSGPASEAFENRRLAVRRLDDGVPDARASLRSARDAERTSRARDERDEES